jgi:FMN phosphatase YigB (HAD superfamily)
MIRAVIFDIGGPIDLETAFEAAIDADIRAGLESEGHGVDDAAWAAAHKYAVDTCAPSLYRSVIWQLTSGDVAKSRRIYDWMEERAHQRSLFELRPGIAETLEALKHRGLKLGLAANQPARGLEDLQRHGIGHYFDNPGISAVMASRSLTCACSSGPVKTLASSRPPASWSATASTTTSCRRSC